MKKNYDVVVIGAGGAGLACAEMLSRTSRRIMLIEKNSQVCKEASGEHHGWFHFGSLYSIFPASNFMGTLIKGTEDLLKYYKNFNNMNISIDKKGRLGIKENEKGWLLPEPIDYYIACGNDADFNLLEAISIKSIYNKLSRRIAWAYVIRKFVARHNQYYDYVWGEGKSAHIDIPKSSVFSHSKKQLKYINNTDINIDIGTHFSIKGFDHPMRAMRIAKDLLATYVANKGQLLLETQIDRIEKGSNCYILFAGEQEIARAIKVIVATGKYEELTKKYEKSVKLIKTISPLLITYPNVANNNFVRMTPFIEKTINHIYHKEGKNKYSVIGGGFYLSDTATESQKIEIENLLHAYAERTFPKFSQVQHREIYWGTKTEYVGEPTERNYQYFSKEIEKNIWIAIPGKFTLSFSLAVDLYYKLNGKLPPENSNDFDEKIDVSAYVGSMRHSHIAQVAAQIEK